MHHESAEGPHKPIEAKDRLLNRRTFGKAALGALLTTGLSSSDFEPPKHIVRDANPEYSRNLVMIDFGPDSFNPNFYQWNFSSDEDLLERELGSQYLDPVERQIVGATYAGIDWISEHVEPANAVFDWAGWDGTMNEQFLRNNPQFAIATESLGYVGDHGQGVQHVMWQTIQSIKEDGTGITPRLYPIQSTIDIHFDQDPFGNYTLVAEADAGKVADALKYYPEQKIVNFSWQIGDVRVQVINNPFECVENEALPLILPQIRREGAYRKEAAVENLSKLFTICDTYPDKLFFAALGNNGDDIREAREELENVWPDNILMIGEWIRENEHDYGKPNFNSFGADIYAENFVTTKNEIRSFGPGSSFSTGQLSATAAFLLSQDRPWQEVKHNMLQDLTDECTYMTKSIPGKPSRGDIEFSRLYKPDKINRLLYKRSM